MAKKANPRTTAIPPMPNTHERRDPRKLLNHPINRKIYGDALDAKFIEDIRNRGVVEELHILPSGIVIAGHRRKQAAVVVGIEEVRVLVRNDLTDPNDIIEAVILSNQHQRERTTEQKVREFECLKEVEESRAMQRMAAGGEGVSCQDTPSGKSRNIAAKQVGMGQETVKKASEVVEKIDEREESGDSDGASELRETLNKNVSKAHRQIQEPKPAEQKKDERPCDKNGYPIPPKAIAVFESVDEFKTLKSRISSLKSDIEKLAETDAGALIRFNPIKIDLENVYRSIRFSTPYCVCPYCRGKKSKCDGCKGTGWGGETLYKNAPEEMK